MTSNDITELEWLASSLGGVAAKLQRAAKLLRCEHDLERAEARLAAIAAAQSGRAAEAERPPYVAPMREPVAIADRRELGPALSAVGGSRTAAVFDDDKLARAKLSKTFKGGAKPPF